LDEGKKSLAATSLAHFVNDGLGGVLPLMYPVFESAYLLSTPAISILASLQNVFSIAVSPFVGRRSDLTGDFAKMIPIGIALFAVGAAGYAFSGVLASGTALIVILLPFTLLIGVGSAFYHPLGATVLRAKWRSEEMGRVMGINGSAGSVGRLVLPLSAAFLISAFTITSVTLIGVLSLAGAFVILVLLRNMRFGARLADRQTESPGPKPAPHERSLTRRLLPLTAVSFSRGLFTVGILPFIPLYLTQVDHFSGLDAGILYSAILGMGIVSQLMFGYMHDHLGPRTSLTISNIGGVMVLFAFSLTSNQLLAIVTALLFGLFSYSAFPLLLGLVHVLTDFNETTTASSIVWGVGNTGGTAVAPLIIGALALPMFFGDLTAGFIASAVIGIVSVILMPLV
jgi:MFS transporter, FSR family, fosmidomycin resistance protein